VEVMWFDALEGGAAALGFSSLSAPTFHGISKNEVL